jgi:hypothetical protein
MQLSNSYNNGSYPASLRNVGGSTQVAVLEIRTHSDDFEISKINNGKKLTTLQVHVPQIINVANKNK